MVDCLVDETGKVVVAQRAERIDRDIDTKGLNTIGFTENEYCR